MEITKKPCHLRSYEKIYLDRNILPWQTNSNFIIAQHSSLCSRAHFYYVYALFFYSFVNVLNSTLSIYRARDLIEKSLNNLKERLDMRRMSVSSEENFEGKPFVQFVALELLSYIKKQMDDKGLFKNYTMQSLLDELDVIECYQQPGKAHHLSEITERQRKLYEALSVPIPT